MSPGDFRAAVVQARLARMRELLADIDRLGAVTAEQLATDRFVRHVAQHVLVQLVQLAVAINSHVAATVVGEAVTDQRASFDAAAGVAGDRGGGGSRLMERYGSESSVGLATALQ